VDSGYANAVGPALAFRNDGAECLSIYQSRVRKPAGIGSEFYILCLTDNYLRREGLMPKDGL
jgi:hypothetical protein